MLRDYVAKYLYTQWLNRQKKSDVYIVRKKKIWNSWNAVVSNTVRNKYENDLLLSFWVENIFAMIRSIYFYWNRIFVLYHFGMTWVISWLFRVNRV